MRVPDDLILGRGDLRDIDRKMDDYSTGCDYVHSIQRRKELEFIRANWGEEYCVEGVKVVGIKFGHFLMNVKHINPGVSTFKRSEDLTGDPYRRRL